MKKGRRPPFVMFVITQGVPRKLKSIAAVF
jgi:hypothetical protein